MRLSLGLVLGTALATGCGRAPIAQPPEVSVPLELTPTPDQPAEPVVRTEVPEDEADEPSAPSGRGGPGAGAQGRAPDPPALRSSLQYELELRYARGHVELIGVRERQFPRPVVTPRRLGRFAVELWIGLELVERVRFDFPLLAASDPPGAALERGLVTTERVLIPATERPTRALLIDRATGLEIEIPWPPVEPEQAPQAGPESEGN